MVYWDGNYYTKRCIKTFLIHSVYKAQYIFMFKQKNMEIAQPINLNSLHVLLYYFPISSIFARILGQWFLPNSIQKITSFQSNFKVLNQTIKVTSHNLGYDNASRCCYNKSHKIIKMNCLNWAFMIPPPCEYCFYLNTFVFVLILHPKRIVLLLDLATHILFAKYFLDVMKNTFKNPLKGFNERIKLMEFENFCKADLTQRQGT